MAAQQPPVGISCALCNNTIQPEDTSRWITGIHDKPVCNDCRKSYCCKHCNRRVMGWNHGSGFSETQCVKCGESYVNGHPHINTHKNCRGIPGHENDECFLCPKCCFDVGVEARPHHKGSRSHPTGVG